MDGRKRQDSEARMMSREKKERKVKKKKKWLREDFVVHTDGGMI